MTNELCATTCASKNFTIAGAEWGKEVSLSYLVDVGYADVLVLVWKLVQCWKYHRRLDSM
jgi:hypothetical protein